MPRHNTNCDVRFIAWAGILLAFVLASAGCGVQMGRDPALDDGTRVAFTRHVASLINATFDRCPAPVEVRQRSDFGGPPWDVWAEFTVSDDAEAAALLRDCLNVTTPYAADVWTLTRAGRWPTAWGEPLGFETFDRLPVGSAVEAIGLEDQQSDTVGRAIRVTRHSADHTTYRIDVLGKRLVD